MIDKKKMPIKSCESKLGEKLGPRFKAIDGSGLDFGGSDKSLSDLVRPILTLAYEGKTIGTSYLTGSSGNQYIFHYLLGVLPTGLETKN